MQHIVGAIINRPETLIFSTHVLGRLDNRPYNSNF